MKSINLKAALGFFFIGMIAANLLMNQKKVCFSNDLPFGFHAPLAVVAFELVKNSVYLEQMLTGPCPEKKTAEVTPPAKEDRVQYLKTLTWWDFLFILFYSGFLYLLSILIAPRRFPILRKICGWLVTGIALTDIGENVFALLLLSALESQTPVQHLIDWMYKFSFSKWMLLFSLVLYLGNFAFRKPKWLQWGFVALFGGLVLWFLFCPLQELGPAGNPTEIVLLASLVVLIGLTVIAFIKPLPK